MESLVPERLRDALTAFRQSDHPVGARRDFYALRKDGGEAPVEIGLQPMGMPEQRLMLATIVDITESRRVQDRFRLVVENAPNAIVMVDGEGEIVLVNAQVERVFGYARGEMLGRSVDFLVPERYRKGHPIFRRAFFARPDARPMGAGRDLYALRKDGSEFPVEIGLVPVETEDGTMVLSAIVDITERKQREERISAALHEKELLLGEVHHRVKNNLQVIDSLLSLQARRVNDPDVHAALRDSQNRIRSLSLIHQTLYQSRDFAFVDFDAFLKQLLPQLVNSMALDRDLITLDVETQEVQLPINLAIPCGLIVNELVTNALKHAFPNGRRGVVRVELARESDDQILMAVSNDGVPITMEFTVEGGGTLGMQLVHLLAQQIQGWVELERRPATRFCVRFPLPLPRVSP
jgi:PAS domain S-box-containing protein